jgi:hypothetical protein
MYGLGAPHSGPSDGGVRRQPSHCQTNGEPSNHRRCARSLFCNAGLIPNSSPPPQSLVDLLNQLDARIDRERTKARLYAAVDDAVAAVIDVAKK